MTTKLLCAGVVTALFTLAGPAFAGQVNGAASFLGDYDVLGADTDACADNGICDTETRTDAFSYSRSQSFSGAWSPTGSYDPLTDTYSPGWGGSPPGTQVGIAGNPKSDYAPSRFTGTVFSAGAKAALGTNGASASIAGGFSGTNALGHDHSTQASASGNWSETVTFGGGSGAGTARIVIAIDGELQAGSGDVASDDQALLSYSFNALGFDPVGGQPTGLSLSESRLVYGGWYDANGYLDSCNGSTSPDCSGPFAKTLEGKLTFAYDQPVQFSASLSVNVIGSGAASALDSATVLAIYVPEGTTYLYESEGLGNPLNITPVPEPGPMMMILAGLCVVGLVARRRLT